MQTGHAAGSGIIFGALSLIYTVLNVETHVATTPHMPLKIWHRELQKFEHNAAILDNPALYLCKNKASGLLQLVPASHSIIYDVVTTLRQKAEMAGMPAAFD
jgi:hypothetical protein